MNVTAAAINKLAFLDRLPLVMQCRLASLNPALNPVQRAMYRLAARYMQANLDNPAYDLLARLQVLESAAKVVKPSPNAGLWSKRPRQGVKAAQDHYAGTDTDPEWFSTGNTGFIGKILGMVRQEVSKRTKSDGAHFSAEDIIQNGLMGLTKDGVGALSTGPLLIHFGATFANLHNMITSGRVSPRDLAGIAGKNFTKKTGDQLVTVDKLRAPTETPSGDNTIDLRPGTESEVSFAAFLQDLLSGSSPLGKKLERGMRELAGNNEVANQLINKLVLGDELSSISAIHKELGGSGSGGSVRWVKDTFYPAVGKLVQNDKDLLAAYWQALGSVRLARRLARR